MNKLDGLMLHYDDLPVTMTIKLQCWNAGPAVQPIEVEASEVIFVEVGSDQCVGRDDLRNAMTRRVMLDICQTLHERHAKELGLFARWTPPFDEDMAQDIRNLSSSVRRLQNRLTRLERKGRESR